jgi:hypothetical protein
VKPNQSAEALTHHLGRDFERAPLYDLISLALEFYAGTPVEGLAADEDADVLLFQYGCYDWGEGELFEFDLTRQFVEAAKTEAGAVSQLSLTMFFKADDDLRALGRKNEWRSSREGLAAFRDAVFSSPAFALAASRARVKVEVSWEPS